MEGVREKGGSSEPHLVTGLQVGLLVAVFNEPVIQNESRDPFGGNVYYVTMQITFLTRKFRNKERNLHCDVVHITTKWVSSLTLDCNGVFAIKAYGTSSSFSPNFCESMFDDIICSLVVHSLS